MFRRKLGLVALILLVFSLLGYTLIAAFGRDPLQKENEEYIVAASFYPVYVLTRNLTEGVPGVQVVNLTENHTGCLHDYQMTTKDMLTLETADLLIINGGDMELFIRSAAEKLPELEIADASAGFVFLEGEGHVHDHDEAESEHKQEAESELDHEAESEHDHEVESVHEHEAGSEHDHKAETDHASGINGHVWLNPNRYAAQIANVTEALCRMDEAHAGQYRDNAKTYLDGVRALCDAYEAEKPYLQGTEVVVFHDAFYYLCEACGIEILHGVDMDADTALSAGEIAEITDEIKLHHVKYLLAEEATGAVAEQLAKQTESTVVYLDPCTSGSRALDAYISAMTANLEKLKALHEQ